MPSPTRFTAKDPAMSQPHPIPSHHGDSQTYDLRPYLEVTLANLKAALLQYRETLPDTLIAMGKFALSGKRKLFSLPEPLDQAITFPAAPWPLYVLLSCRASLGLDN